MSNFSNHTNEAYLYQHVDFIKGIPFSKIGEYKLKKYEFWTEAEINKIISLTKNEDYGKYVSSMIYDSEREVPEIAELIKFINSKRAFAFVDEEGERKFIMIPSDRQLGENLDHYSDKLMRVAISYYQWVGASPEVKNEAFDRFTRARKSLFVEITKRLLSKNFKEKYQFTFNGISGVALTGNCDFDEICIPQWYAEKYNLKEGDIGLVTRDPIQNIVIALRVSKITTHNELRVNAQTYTLLDGDFDGDRIQFIPFKKIAWECQRLGVAIDNTIKSIFNELKNILPSNIMNSQSKERLVRDYTLSI